MQSWKEKDELIQNLAIAALTLILSLPSVGHFLCSALVEMFTCARVFHSFLTISEGNKGLLGLSLNQFLSLVYSSPRFYAELPRSHKSLLFLRRRSCCVITCERYLHGMHPGREGVGVTWVNFCWVCAVGLSEPLPHYSLFCGQL